METALQTIEAKVALTPEQQVQKASEMAKVLQKVVNQAGLARKFGGQKEHLQFEAWQTIGQFFTCTPVTEWSKPINEDGKIIGWESRVNVTNIDGRIIGSAESMCMKDEPNWKNKPNYAIRSMSQTRAAGKALRSVFAWVAVLAGYSGTPAEEMEESFSDKPMSDKPMSMEPATPAESSLGNTAPMTDKQRGKLWAMCKGDKELTDTEAKNFMAWYQGQPGTESVNKDGKMVLSMKSASAFIENFETLFEAFTKV